MAAGAQGAERIEDELRRADFLITFLSARSVHSEMVEAEISTARRLAAERDGRPAILPVRLAYHEPFAYPLSAYLNPINWAEWDGDEDTSRLIDELLRAIAGEQLSFSKWSSTHDLNQIGKAPALPQPLPSAQPASLELPEGTMDPQSAFYVLRPSDAIASETIARQGVTITLKGPRQMGKSSLLIRTIDAAARAGKRTVFLDFQLLDRATLTDADLFFRQFCAWLTDELDIPSRVDEHWNTPLSNSQRCTRYMGRYILREINSLLVLAMDEVESIFDTDFRTDFFGMLRSWHNNRATAPTWKHLDLVLVTSTEPYQLIDNLNQSPFNVGEVIELADLSANQVTDLNRRHGSPLGTNDERRLMALLGGHPYLVRRALYLVAAAQLSAADLFAGATDEGGPFGDHLRYHLFRLHEKPELLRGLRQVIQSHTCQDERIFFRLRGAGLVRRDGRTVLPRCQLYADYFQEHLDDLDS
jgi:hypothetical protein